MLKFTLMPAAVFTAVALLTLQAQGPQGGSGMAASKAKGPPAYPDRRPTDTAAIARGKALYSLNCSFCHGEDARGGEEAGPNLIRSDVLLRDQNGELLAPILQNGRGAMPKFSLTAAQTSDIATFIHSFGINSRDPARKKPPSIVVGDAKAGAAYFNSKCASCHAASGDLAGIASRITDARTLQQTWLIPRVAGGRGGGPQNQTTTKVPPVTVTVASKSGTKVEGRLIRIDDFLVTLADETGAVRTFRLSEVQAEVHDPLKPHQNLLPLYTDKDIHDVTAYLVTLK